MNERAKNTEGQRPRYHPFWPHHVLQETCVAVLVFAALLTLATFAPAGIAEKADPYTTPEHIKPEWYFLASYQFLKVAEVTAFLGPWAPKVIGVFGQGIVFAVFFLFPFLDRNPDLNPYRRLLAVSLAAAGLVVWLAFTVWGHFS